jgi:hypothetical protein
MKVIERSDGHLNKIGVSDRTALRGLTQFVLDDLASVPLSDWYRARCRIECARREVLRYTVPDRSQVIDSKRRDAGAVDQARLESDSGEAHRVVPKHPSRNRFNDFPPQNAS